MGTAQKKPETNDARKLVTPEFRVSYPHLFKPNAIKGGKPKYSVSMLFPKSADLSSIKLAIKHAKIDKWGPNKNEWPEDLQSPVDDGDSPKHEERDGYKGHWVIKASTNEEYRPEVVGPDAQPILNASEFYPGCYARAYVFAYAWEYMGKNGVSFILDHVQKTRDGKPFGGKRSASDVFTPINAGMGDSESDELEVDDFS